MSTRAAPTTVVRALIVEVIGTPAPQGSKSYKGMRAGKPVLVESSLAVGPWREAVAWAVRSAMTRDGWLCTTGAVQVEIDFYLARPVSAPKRRTRPDRRPDLDKLVRSTLDALTTAGAIDDDARVVEIIARKRYAESWCGARITVRTDGPCSNPERRRQPLQLRDHFGCTTSSDQY